MRLSLWLSQNCRCAAIATTAPSPDAKSSNFRGKSMVSPNGDVYYTDNHLEWSQDNFAALGVDFKPTQNLDYEKTSDPEDAVMDENGHIALYAFLDAGWIRVQWGSGIEMSYLSSQNIRLVRSMLQQMAKENPGREIYVEVGGNSLHVPVSFTGRPDFSELKAEF